MSDTPSPIPCICRRGVLRLVNEKTPSGVVLTHRCDSPEHDSVMAELSELIFQSMEAQIRDRKGKHPGATDA